MPFRSWGRITGPSARSTAPWLALCNWRTLPGQEPRGLASIAAAETVSVPIPSPVALDLSAGDALPPQWPWASTKRTTDWDPARDRDIKPGILPTPAWANWFDDGWRHQALLRFHDEGDVDAGPALEALIHRPTA